MKYYTLDILDILRKKNRYAVPHKRKLMQSKRETLTSFEGTYT